MRSSSRPGERRILVTGAGGFIGHHLIASLIAEGHWVRGADTSMPRFGATDADEFLEADLRRAEDAARAMDGIDEVYALAATVGGVGFLGENQSSIFRTNALIDINTVDAAASAGVKRLMFASSAFVYPEHLQTAADSAALKESDAYPAAPDSAYGWEKLLGERLCSYYAADSPMATRVVRFHNIYGPLAPWTGGQARVPAAICRKVAIAKRTGARHIEIWGDGQQTRSFCFVSDAVEGLCRVMDSDVAEPLNVGSAEMTSIDDLAKLVMDIAGVELRLEHVDGPQGVRGRRSDNTRIRSLLNWEPSVSLADGMAQTYRWIEGQVAASPEPDRFGHK
ncbi:MAG TPA: NAD-dependent epimerase/dehydratase family protein [Ilumatobacteraceae bacterium]|nr:NAD-dependent epimerase/dehydratase family protein [Ilumatobacteraceae bacterium]